MLRTHRHPIEPLHSVRDRCIEPAEPSLADTLFPTIGQQFGTDREDDLRA